MNPIFVRGGDEEKRGSGWLLVGLRGLLAAGLVGGDRVRALAVDTVGLALELVAHVALDLHFVEALSHALEPVDECF